MDAGSGNGSDSAESSAFDPLSFYVGRVVRGVSPGGGVSTVGELSEYVDREAGTIESATGELHWDYRRGVLLIDSPHAQGAVGFLKSAGVVSLGDIRIESPVEYGAILVVSLDGEPLATSGRLLVQVMTEDRNYGWRTTVGTDKDRNGVEWTYRRITDLGGPPIVVKDLSGTVSLRREDAEALRVTALDFNGRPRGTRPSGSSGEVGIELLADCIYYLVSR
jgi:hypothetical protein